MHLDEDWPENAPALPALRASCRYDSAHRYWIPQGGSAEFAYSDGDSVETRLLEIVKSATDLASSSLELQQRATDWPTRYHLGLARSTLLRPLAASLADKDILEIGAGCGAITRFLAETGHSVVAVEGSPRRAAIAAARCRDLSNVAVIADAFHHLPVAPQFDVVTLIGVLEYARKYFPSSESDPVDAMLARARAFLRPGGVLLVAIENQLGLKYFAGFAEDHLGMPMAGIENQYTPADVVTFGRHELQERLHGAGFADLDWWYPFPDYKLPVAVFSAAALTGDFGDELLPILSGAASADAQRPESVNFCLERAWATVLKNSLGPELAHSFLVAARCGDRPAIAGTEAGETVLAYHYAVHRRREFAKRVSVSADASGKLLIRQTRLYSDAVAAEDSPVALRLETEEFIHGQQWQQTLLNRVTTPGWSLTDLCDWAGVWYDAVLRRTGLEAQRGLLTAASAIPGEYFDAVPRNLIIATDGQPRFFDQEWRLRFPMELGFLLYRGLLFSLLALPQVAPPRPGTPLKLLDVFYKLTHSLGIWLIDADVRRYVEYENDIQAWVSGGTGSEYRDLAAYHLPVQTTLQSPAQRREQLTALYQTIAEKEQTIAAKETEIAGQRAIAEDMTRQLRDREADLRSIHSSRGWRVLTRYYELRERLLPFNSRRRLLAKVTAKAVRHPRQCWQRLSWANLKKLVRYARTEGAANAFNRMDGYISRYSESPSPALALYQAADVPQKLVFPAPDQPRFSIVVPAYNEWAYTRLCLYSILRHSEGLAYEVIVADDGSTDETVNIGHYAENIRVIRPETNLGFLRNCNQAAAQARGEFIVFLNNDTQVQPGWLAKLAALMDRDPQAGLVGSKLVYPDGRLQEAGGIIWRDASGWNYGRMDDPAKPEYNYVKPVDYISGAAIMIRSCLWREIGGFDERYAPAYYEDTDLAFAVRQCGYQTMYQPESVVVHFEGVSNGTDVSAGTKRYQQVNQRKFREKWQQVLMAGQFPPAENVFLARDRSRDRKTIVVVDHYVPHFDRDAGGRCTYTYIKLFLRLGLRVIFVGDNYFPHQPYTSELEQLGVEVLYGSWYQSHFADWLQEHGKFIDYAYLNRPHIACKYIDLFRQHSGAKIIYFGHDLHFLREMRQYELDKNPALLAEANRSKEQEMKLFNQADVIHVVGSYEEEYLRKLLPEKPIRNIPLYVYTDAELEQRERSCAGTADLLFVGGFGHQPNADGVLWFVQEIWPAIVAALPQIRLTVVGSNAPPAIAALASSQIRIAGYVSDAELAELYRNCRIVVVPLRFGAGVKGKVVEAIYYQVPVVTTSIGAEGLNNDEGLMVVADDATDFARAVIRLYCDTEYVQTLPAKSQQYIHKYFSTEAALQVLQLDITAPK